MAASATEQLLLELINDARLDPMGNAARYITSYAPLVASQANIQSALSFFGVGGLALQSAYLALTPAQPLAWNEQLSAAAEGHNAAMIAANMQTHQAPGEPDLGQRLHDQGYAYQGAAENVYAYASDPLQAHAAFMVDWGGPDNGMQSPPGHRNNIMNPALRDIGIASTSVNGGPLGPLVITEDFGVRNTTSIMLLGVAYTDTDANNFYSFGEGLANLSVTFDGKMAVTPASGGYTLETTGAGTKTVAFSGPSILGAVTFTGTFVAGQNAKVDLIDGHIIHTSVSGTLGAGQVDRLEGLGLVGLSLTTGGGAQTIIGTKGNDTLNGGAGADTTRGGLGGDKFVFDGLALIDGQSSIFDHVADYRQGNSGLFSAAEGDQLDLSAILGAAFGGGQPVSSLVRLVEDASLKFTKLQVDADGTAGGVQWTTLAQLDGIHTSHTASVIVSGGAPGGVTVGVQASIGNYVDFGGEGRADLLWRSDAGGLAIWNMNGGAVTGANDLGIVDSSWRIFGTGDFNADNKGDIVWRNDGGALAIWNMNGGTVASVSDLGTIAGTWQIIGVADFNGDSKSDLLWRDASGFTAIWQMNGGSVASVTSLGTVEPSWHVIGLADVNGDSKSDMIWRNDAGFLAIWEMNGGAVTKVDSLGTITNDWHIVGSGDFNGDTKSDLIWRNDAGALVIWEMNGGTVMAVDNLGLIGDNWHIAGVGDFNDDNKADLMWNSDAGAAALWIMNGGTVAGVADLGTIGQNWTTINHHYDFV